MSGWDAGEWVSGWDAVEWVGGEKTWRANESPDK